MKEGAKLFESKHPEIKIVPKGFKKWLIRFSTLQPIPRVLGLLKKEWEWYFLFKEKMR